MWILGLELRRVQLGATLGGVGESAGSLKLHVAQHNLQLQGKSECLYALLISLLLFLSIAYIVFAD